MNNNKWNESQHTEKKAKEKRKKEGKKISSEYKIILLYLEGKELSSKSLKRLVTASRITTKQSHPPFPALLSPCNDYIIIFPVERTHKVNESWIKVGLGGSDKGHWGQGFNLIEVWFCLVTEKYKNTKSSKVLETDYKVSYYLCACLNQNIILFWFI